MREILFKAKRIDNGEWVEGIPIKTHIGTFIVFEENPHYCSQYGYMEIDGLIKVDSNTICQYTGLTDIDGNKIWENDTFAYGEEMGVIRFGENGDYKYDYGFYVDFGDSFLRNDLGFWIKERTIKIIGNIFDNQ